jgi:hypothetical protein
MSNPTKIYNDYVRANLPSTMTFDTTTDRYDINNHSFLSFKEASWYFKYVTKYGYTSLSVYAVNNFDPDLVFDFKQNYYRTGGTETTLSPAVTHTRASSATMTNSSGNIVTVGNNVARVGHHVYNGSAWVNEGILHESEARTNLLTHSNGFTDSSWNRTQISTITANAGLSPDGTLNAYKVVPNTNLNVHYTYKDFDAISTNVYSFSVYVASAGYGFATVSVGTNGSNDYYAVVVDLSNGTKTATYSAVGQSDKSCTVEAVGSFYRVTISGQGEKYYVVGASPTGTYSSGGITHHYGFNSFNGDGTSGILVYGAQLEAGSTPSSYIPTSGSTVTRAADTLTVPAANLPYSSTNMSIQMDGKMTYADDDNSALPNNQGTTGEAILYLWKSANDSHLNTTLVTRSARAGEINFQQRSPTSGGTVLSGGSAYSPNINVPFNIASRYGSTFLNGSHEGTLLTANTSMTALPDLSSADLLLGYIFMGTIAQFRVWDEDLTDTGIVEATEPSTEPSLQLTFDGSSTTSFTVLDWSE